MSIGADVKRITVHDIRQRKGGAPLAVLTAYTATMARLLDPLVDIILVGDSLGMVIYGMETTLGVTVEMMINHGAAVVRASRRACIIIDMPFGSYQESPQTAFRTAAQVMATTGCAGVKLEGGDEMAETISFLVQRGIPVMGHVGLLPQSVHALGGFRTQGRDEASAATIVADAIAVAEAGVFSLVVEGVMEPLGRRITERVPVPTIGIGASPACDGQVLVTEDMLGLFDAFQPRFVKRFANLGIEAKQAFTAYVNEVRARTFPGPEHCFWMKKDS
ncbi:3-methyl-2-oxobutanoate hydroxymethyltransferase [invertebrate metagenome]|uniref:3-methyl-2-oxobutanoate hydroxymethyltransferase n=1 Tax=invertebrate metagenome TaxID=1711999 RepID=A0A484H9S9_9ZZZZ